MENMTIYLQNVEWEIYIFSINRIFIHIFIFYIVIFKIFFTKFVKI